MNNQEETTPLKTYHVTTPNNFTPFVVKGYNIEYGADGTELEITNNDGEAVAFFPQFTSWIEVKE